MTYPEYHHLQLLPPAEVELAMPVLEATVEGEPDNPVVKCHLADCYLTLGRFAEAEALYRAARDAAPELVHAHCGLLYLEVRDKPAVLEAINLPLRLRRIHGQLMLVWYAFPDLQAELDQHPHFNRTLGRLAKVLQPKYPDLAILDIGANCAQSVAEVYAQQPVPMLSVECGMQNYALCHYNTKRIHPQNEAVQALVGPEGLHGAVRYWKSFELENAAKPEWIYATPVGASDEGAVPTVALTTIVKTHPRFANSKLVKIDAEGWDWQIIIDSASFWQQTKPIIFFEHNFEYVKDRQAAHTLSLQAIKTLLNSGYNHFLVYEVHGKIMQTINHEHLQRMHELNLHLYLHKQELGPWPYLDICAIHDEDIDLIPAIYQSGLSADLQGIKPLAD